ncbi:MAG: galactosyltransferase-related protein [Bacteroidetes bacterium]|nr:galactosyltransferase-related protein [Bacteroidota bacterium]MCL6102958.1 galactosyltransferase-related protein [Bacteroidota bacterium]
MKNSRRFLDLTILLIVRLDTIDRLENILAVTAFINSNFLAKISVLECAPFNNGILKRLLDEKIRYAFQEDHDPILYRTKFLNQMIQSADTPFVAVWDIDIIFQVNQLIEAMKLLRKGEADFVIPYEKYMLDTSPILRKIYLEEGKIEVLEQNVKKLKEMYVPDPVGGVFLANLQAYVDSGLENENFYGWGLEDVERYNRWMNLGYRVKRVPGTIFHLNHGRGINSIYHNADQQIMKHKEIISVRRNMGSESTKSLEE